MKPTVRRVKAEGYKIRVIDLQYTISEAVQYNVESIPTFIHVRSGEPDRRSVGTMSAESLRNFCRGW